MIVAGPLGDFHPVAVTTDARPLFFVDHFWSGGQTAGRTDGVPVSALHPAALPPADVLKCDAEGVEAEVLEHYRTLADCLAVVYEFHTPRLRTRCRELMRERTKMRLVRAENVATYGTDIWVP